MNTKINHKAKRMTGWCAVIIFGAATLAFGRDDPADEDITVAVERLMLTHEEVPSHWIDVSTHDGIVTLEGTIHNLLAKEKATEIAGHIEAVRSVVNRIDVRPVERDDADIRADLVSALAMDTVADRYAITVRVDDGVVSLSGNVPEHAVKELCAEIAKGVRGVKGVENQITVDYIVERTDADIERLVERLLESDVRIDSGLVNVDVDDSRVILSGTVGSAAERSAAISTAWVLGTRQVDAEDLEVAWWKRDKMVRTDLDRIIQDPDIETAIRDALAEDPRVWAFDIDVRSSDGVIALRGTVGDLRAKRTAEDIAENTVGVRDVASYLRVRPEPVISDAEIIEEVEAALARDPFLGPFDVTVTCRNGLVMLYGTVDTHYERRQAENLASNVRGVIDVRNHIHVREMRFGRNDEALEADIRNRLRWNPRLDSGRIQVEVSDGIATFTGVVPTRWAYREATRIATDSGARAIDNRLEIR